MPDKRDKEEEVNQLDPVYFCVHQPNFWMAIYSLRLYTNDSCGIVEFQVNNQLLITGKSTNCRVSHLLGTNLVTFSAPISNLVEKCARILTDYLFLRGLALSEC